MQAERSRYQTLRGRAAEADGQILFCRDQFRSELCAEQHLNRAPRKQRINPSDTPRGRWDSEAPGKIYNNGRKSPLTEEMAGRFPLLGPE